MSLRLVVSVLMLITTVALGMIAYQLALPPRVAVTSSLNEGQLAPLQTAYFVAAHSLPQGTFIRDEDFGLKSVLSGKVPPNAIPDQPENRASLRGALVLEEDEMITQADLVRPRDRGFLATVLEPGTRAVALAVDAVSGVAGLIWPGDRVDVLLTQELDHAVAPLARRVIGETVLSNVRVIAVDQDIVRTAPATGSTIGRGARTVTLQVAADQAERATVAQQLGHLVLAVRSIDSDVMPDVDRPSLFSGDVSPALSKQEEPAGVKIQVIEGDKRSEVTFQ